MQTFLVLLFVFILLSIFLYFSRPKTRLIEKSLGIIHILTLPLLIIVFVLLGENMRFAGQYTNSAIAVIFLATGILLFGAARSKRIRIYAGFISIPALVIEISLLIGATPLFLPAFIAWLMFAPPKLSEKINDKYNLEVHQGGIMTSPNLFYLSERKGWVNKTIPLTKSNEYFETISGIETINFVEHKYVVCKIYGGNGKEFTIDTLQYEN